MNGRIVASVITVAIAILAIVSIWWLQETPLLSTVLEYTRVPVVILLVPLLVFLGVREYLTRPGKWVKKYPTKFLIPGPQRGHVVMVGKKVERIINGAGVSHSSDNLDDPGALVLHTHKAVTVDEQGNMIEDGDDPILGLRGGQMNPLILVLDAWVYHVAGARVAAASISGLINGSLFHHDLKRLDGLRDTMKGKPIDDTNHFRASLQTYPMTVTGAETGAIVEIVVGEIKQRTPERIKFSVRLQVVFKVVDLRLALFESGGNYFELTWTYIVEAIREVVQEASANDLMGPEGKKRFEPAVVKANKRCKTVGTHVVALPIEDIIPDAEFVKALQQQATMRLEVEAKIAAATQDVTLAETELQAALQRAKAAAAPAREQLVAEAEGIAQLKEKAGFTNDDNAEILRLQQVKSGANVTIIGGGQGGAPNITPAIVLPVQEGRKKRE